MLDSPIRHINAHDNCAEIPLCGDGKVSWISHAVLLAVIACTGCLDKKSQPQQESGNPQNGVQVAPPPIQNKKIDPKKLASPKTTELKKEKKQRTEARIHWEKLLPEQQEELIAATRAYVLKHKATVADVLEKELKNGARFVLIGEHHWKELEGQRRSVASSLTQLKEAGLTHVGIEADRGLQDALDTLSLDVLDSEQEVEQCLKLPSWEKGLAAIVVEAKKLGLRVLCIDDYAELHEHNKRWAGYGRSENPDGTSSLANFPDAYWNGLAHIEYRRNQDMCTYVEHHVAATGKILIYIGQAHVDKIPMAINIGIPALSLGSGLSKKYGNEAVISVRDILGREFHFDGRCDFSHAAPVQKVLTTDELHEVFLLPDTGPVRGPAGSTQTDYLIVGGYPESPFDNK